MSFEEGVEFAKGQLLERGKLDSMIVGYREGVPVLCEKLVRGKEFLEMLSKIFMYKGIDLYMVMMEVWFKNVNNEEFDEYIEGNRSLEECDGRREGLVIAEIKDSRNVKLKTYSIIRKGESLDLLEEDFGGDEIIGGWIVELLDT